jgi:APA family basic amino acid/polyamine antiporter
MGGMVTMLVAMILAEVASMIPDEGGTYNLMRHMYGEFWAYLYGWACFAVINCAGTAGIAFIFSEYLNHFITLPSFDAQTERSFSIAIPMIGEVFPLEHFGVKLCTVAIITMLSVVSYRSTKAGGNLQMISTAAKLLAIAILSIGILFSGNGDAGHFLQTSETIRPMGFALVLAMAAAINGALQAFDGATNLLNMTGEIRDPARNIPRSLFWGIWICIGVYLIVNAGMIYALDIDTMAGSTLVASNAAQHSFGALGESLVIALICLSVFGTTNANIMSPPRLTFSMARHHHFLASAGRIHPRFGTPGNAILFHLVFMILLVFSGSFYMLTDMYIFIVWFFNLFLIGGLFILRKKMPEAKRPYKVWGYPWMPLTVLICNTIFLGLIVYGDWESYMEGKTAVVNSLAGMVLTALGIPLYFYLKWRKRS